MNIMNKKPKQESMTTYDELMQDPEFKEIYDKSYHELMLSELFLAIMAEDKISIRSLAKQPGISPAIIQDIRSGKRDNLTLKTFATLMDVLGYTLILENRTKGTRQIHVKMQHKDYLISLLSSIYSPYRIILSQPIGLICASIARHF